MFYYASVTEALAYLEARGECWAGYFTAVHDAAVKRRDDDDPAEGPAP